VETGGSSTLAAAMGASFDDAAGSYSWRTTAGMRWAAGAGDPSWQRLYNSTEQGHADRMKKEKVDQKHSVSD